MDDTHQPGPSNLQDLFNTIPTSPATVPSPAGVGTNPFNYTYRPDVVQAVSLLPNLPRGRDRIALIRHHNIRPDEVNAARNAYLSLLADQGSVPITTFPDIDWGAVRGSLRTARPIGVGTGRSSTSTSTATTTTATRRRGAAARGRGRGTPARGRARPPVPRRVLGAPSGPPSDSSSSSSSQASRRSNQRGMHDRLDQLIDGVHQRARRHDIRNITHTHTVTTVYEEPNGGRRPTVRRTSTRNGPGR